MTRTVLIALAVLCLAPVPGRADDGDLSGVVVGFGDNFRERTRWDMDVRYEGSVVVRFSGPGQSGTIVWTPGRIGQLTAAHGRTRNGRLSYAGYLGSTGGQMTVARVWRGERLCTDWARALFDGAAVEDGPDGVSVRLVTGGPSGAGFRLTETNCGGPLPRAFARLLPKVGIPAAKLTRGRFDVDLRGSGAFTDGALTGTVDSTLVAHVGRRRSEPRDLSPSRPTRYRLLESHYAIERVSGTVAAAFRGSELCDELASCGDSGSWLLRAQGSGSAILRTFAPLKRPLRDLRTAAGLTNTGNPAGLDVGGGGDWPSRTTTLHATVAGCSDTRHVGGGSLNLAGDGRFVNVSLYAGFGETRTSCPGPGLADDVAGTLLGTARIPRTALARRRLRIAITGTSSLATDGWLGSTQARFTVVLRRTHVNTLVAVDPG